MMPPACSVSLPSLEPFPELKLELLLPTRLHFTPLSPLPELLQSHQSELSCARLPPHKSIHGKQAEENNRVKTNTGTHATANIVLQPCSN